MFCSEQLQQYIATIKDVVTIISIIIGGVVAILGLRTWRRQLTGIAQYELGKRLLKATYKLRNAVDDFRRETITAKEVLSAIKRDNLDLDVTNPQFASIGIEAAMTQRWKKVIEAYEDIKIELLEVEALWGIKAKETVAELRSVFSFFQLKAIIFLEYGNNPPDDVFKIDERGFIHGFYETGKENDKDILESFNSTIVSIEKLVKPHLIK